MQSWKVYSTRNVLRVVKSICSNGELRTWSCCIVREFNGYCFVRRTLWPMKWKERRESSTGNTSKFKSGLFSLFSFHLILHFCTCNWIVRLEFYCKWQMANKLTNGSFEFDAVSYDALKMNRVYANVYLRSEKQIIFESSRNCEHFILCKFRPLIMTMLLLLRAVNALWCISNYPTTYIVELMCTRSAFACSHLEMVYGIIIDCQVNR